MFRSALYLKNAVRVLALEGVLCLVSMMRLHRQREEHALQWILGRMAGVAIIWCDPLLVRKLGFETCNIL